MGVGALYDVHNNYQLSIVNYRLHINYISFFFFGLSVFGIFGYFFGVLGLTDACCSKIQNKIQN